MNLLSFNHSLSSLFVLSFRIYKKNFISILFLTAALVAPAFFMGFAGWGEAESIVFFLSVHMLEAAITLGVIGLAFGSFFPTLSILRAFRSPLFLGSIHVAILQYLLFITGVMGLTLPFPFSILVITLWLGGLLLTSMAQPVFIVEGLRGTRAMIRSIQLARANLSRVFLVVLISTVLQFIVFALLFTIFMPDLDLNIEPNEGGTLPILLSDILKDPGVNMAIRWSQYLASLLFYPFASLLSSFLYFDLAQRQKVINLDHLEQFSNHLFGTDINQNKDVRKTPAEEEVKSPPVTDIIDTDPSKEDKDK
ncbi:MAG: hypothetical protein VYD83_09275 [SAR324 cluster bacterium]|nr:hypothetical protein [SAR324 cluster bacterium]